MKVYWQKRRTELNHDWLKNRFMPALSKWLNLLDDKLNDPNFEGSFINSVLGEWEENKEQILELSKSFEHEMSPARLFDWPPLSYCDDETKCWLGKLLHTHWVETYSVHQLVAESIKSVEQIEACYQTIKESLPTTQTISAFSLRPLKQQFRALRDTCQILANNLSRFPTEIKVI